MIITVEQFFGQIGHRPISMLQLVLQEKKLEQAKATQKKLFNHKEKQ
jgi:hypothetical protein